MGRDEECMLVGVFWFSVVTLLPVAMQQKIYWPKLSFDPAFLVDEMLNKILGTDGLA